MVIINEIFDVNISKFLLYPINIFSLLPDLLNLTEPYKYIDMINLKGPIEFSLQN